MFTYKFHIFKLHNSNINIKTYALYLLHTVSIRSYCNTTKLVTQSQDSIIAEIILKNYPKERLLELCRRAEWSAELVDRVLKRLWNDGPKAVEFFMFMDRYPRYKHAGSSFDHAIDICGRMRDYKTMWWLVKEMRKQGVGPGARTFAIIIERFISDGKSDRAVKTFIGMHEHGCMQDLKSFNTLLDLLCKSGRVAMAYSFFRVFSKRFGADTISYNILANGWCLIKKTSKGLEVLEDMVERGLEPTVVTYNIMLKGFFRASQVRQAWDFFQQMKERDSEIDVITYTTIIHGFGVVGEIEKAKKVFKEMVERGYLPTVPTYNAIIGVLCKKDDVENAIVAFEEMLRKGYVPNTTTYNAIIRGLCHRGEMDRALALMGRMKDDECLPTVQTYNIVIRYFCDAGKTESALGVFKNMCSGECLPNLDTYNVLISAMFVRKKTEDLLVAGKLLLEMIDRGFMPRGYTFNRVLNGLLMTGNQEFAKEILRLQSQCGRLPRKFRL